MDRREFLKTVTQTAAVAAASSFFPSPAGAVPDRLRLVAVDVAMRSGPSSVCICSLWTMPVVLDEMGNPVRRTLS